MKLKVKDVNLSTGGPLVAVLNEEDARRLDLHAIDRVKVEWGRKRTTVTIDIAKDENILPGEIGLFEEVLKKLGVKRDSIVDVDIEKKPDSVAYIKKKLDGYKLNEEEINEIIKDAVDNKLTEVELTFFVSGCYTNGMNLDEVVALTNAIVNSGNQLKLDKPIVVDKHGSGGTPGNRTTMVIIPIVAAAGLAIAKTSSRAITSGSGTADVMEVLAKVSFPTSQIKKIVEKTNGCMVWSGAMDLANADDILIKIEHPLSLDPTGILLSSIMAKKKAVGATHVLIDISHGKGAKIQTRSRALHLKKMFKKLGKKLGIKVKVILTDGTQPIGNGIGPALEARDVLYVLMNDERAPKELREKSVNMAGLILKMAGNGDEKTALEILESGKAYEKMKEIIKAQDGNPDIKPDDIKIGKYSYIVRSKKEGHVVKIDNKAIAKIVRVAGAPKDKEAGLYLNVHKGDKVRKGDILFTVYAKNKKKLDYTLDVFKRGKVIEIS